MTGTNNVKNNCDEGIKGQDHVIVTVSCDLNPMIVLPTLV